MDPDFARSRAGGEASTRVSDAVPKSGVFMQEDAE